jgi:hypothetical protein
VRLDLGKRRRSLTRYCRLERVVRVVPSVDVAAGVDRRDRWQLQLYGIVRVLRVEVLPLGERKSARRFSSLNTR